MARKKVKKKKIKAGNTRGRRLTDEELRKMEILADAVETAVDEFSWCSATIRGARADRRDAEEEEGRPWKCPLCSEGCRVTYDELAENGVPVCDTCGLDMILVDE